MSRSPGLYSLGTMIEAAGGGIARRTSNGRIEVLLVHRPAHGDWSLPKGKLHPGETALGCALREVREETGLLCSASDELPSVRYNDRKGRPKRVRYWAMHAYAGEFECNDEVDEIGWFRTERALRTLTYVRELIVVSTLVTSNPVEQSRAPYLTMR